MTPDDPALVSALKMLDASLPQWRHAEAVAECAHCNVNYLVKWVRKELATGRVLGGAPDGTASHFTVLLDLDGPHAMPEKEAAFLRQYASMLERGHPWDTPRTMAACLRLIATHIQDRDVTGRVLGGAQTGDEHEKHEE